MHSSRITLLILTLIALFSANAFAIELGAGAGAYIPTNNDYYDYGYQLEAHADFGVIPALVDIRLSASYANATGSDAGYDYEVNTYGGQLLAVLAPAIPIIKPYVGVGYGLYSNEETIDGHGISKTNDNIGHGPVVKAGIGINVLIIRLGLDGQYFMNNGSGDDEDFSGYTLGLSAGLSF